MTISHTFYEERSSRLAETDFITKVIIDHQVMSKPIPQKYIDVVEYRQKLRDLPEQDKFDVYDPDSYKWPTLY